jgi:FixJ family two-component response regulator
LAERARARIDPQGVIMVEERAVVFVIDDDPSMRLALEDLVSTVGLEVRAFAAPQEFLQSKPPDAPGCLVLDVRLPGMSGLTLQKELAKEGLALPQLVRMADRLGEHIATS